MPAASKTSPLHLSSLHFHLFLYLSSSTHECQSLAAGLGAVKPKRAHLWLPLGGNKWLTAWSPYLCKINITEREKERGRQHLYEQLEKLNPQTSEQLPVSTAFFLFIPIHANTNNPISTYALHRSCFCSLTHVHNIRLVCMRGNDRDPRGLLNLLPTWSSADWVHVLHTYNIYTFHT